MNIREILKQPLVYQTFQRLGGFFSARLKAIQAHLPLNEGDKVLDIGCGPGFIVNYMPKGISYYGFDIDKHYIAYANAKFGHKGRFICGFFNEDTASQYREADIVMMNGVLHHLTDEEVDQTLCVIKKALKPGGRLFTLDGCFVEGQSVLAHMLLKYDRGNYVRTQDHYRSLIIKHFDLVDVHVENSLSWVPYTWIIM
ncbi:partial demethylmenaquinone methyltransferase / 2-methoxy-6-polyprenyl-1,4-benzoquinol methylase, partial [Methylococcales bacterium]